LEELFKLPVHREDESFTSQMASQSLKTRSKKKRGRRPDKSEIDRVAACYILQDFLDSTANGYKSH
jgi:putative holliday junction resolvase